jgi:group II intron reverse transcriptase/maturase
MRCNSTEVSTKQQRIATLAKQSPDMAFTSLAYMMDLAWLFEAYQQTRKNGAAGIDGVTAAEYEQDLEGNLRRLLARAKSGSYRAPPVRRVYIPKGTSTEVRPIGIPTLEDKILQRAVVMLLDPIYEQDFLDCSYGFRRQRSAHQALESLWKQTMDLEGGWILEVDIRKFFDHLDHGHLRELLQHRVNDGVLKKLINKWLKAGVMEDGNVSYPDSGSPQGGVISPLLSNVFLHYVLDVWFEEVVKPRLGGHAFLIRFADDFAIGFRSEADARRVMEVLPKRFAKYGLTTHPEKTRLVCFERPSTLTDDIDSDSMQGSSGTFDLLGFTHYWGRSRKGTWVVKRKTSSSRFTRAISKVAQWCRLNRHLPVSEQQLKLRQKLHGHYAYYGIRGNYAALARFKFEVHRRWHQWLNRRNRQRELTWDKFNRLLKRYPLPPPRIHQQRPIFRPPLYSQTMF